MHKQIIQRTFLEELLDGVEISESEMQQLQTVSLIAQTKSAVELVIGLSPEGRDFMTDLVTLLGKYVAKLEPTVQQQYIAAIQGQMNSFGAKIVKQMSPQLTQDELQKVAENLKKLTAS